LGNLGRFSLRLGSCGQKSDKGVPDGLLNGIRSLPIEHHVVDHCVDGDTLADEMTDHISNIVVVSTEPIHPSDHKVVTLAEFIEQSATFWSIPEDMLNPGHPMVGNDFIDIEPGGSGLVNLVVKVLVGG
jgi:hypothetical protein